MDFDNILVFIDSVLQLTYWCQFTFNKYLDSFSSFLLIRQPNEITNVSETDVIITSSEWEISSFIVV